ncbi:Uncharacterised protein [Serratia quinivorans]|uniref:hypothetical protein n=1 Tax=Serratia quinivorans TaxID=137545 RepID=UPI002179B35B|nr:hypothetical protein [Serratia quinivorans]CAI1960338.1 Uncharacterised protein [Serratia quinivorans]
MSTIGLYIAAHIFKSTTSAVNLAHATKSNDDIDFAKKLISVKMSSCKLDPAVELKLNKYERLINQLNSIRIPGGTNKSVYNQQQDVHPDDAGGAPIIKAFDRELSINDLVIKKDVNTVYRIDQRPPLEIANYGFTPHEKSMLGPAGKLLQGQAWCAGECISKAMLPNGKKEIIEPMSVFNELSAPASANKLSNWHIYKVNTMGTEVARYVDNVDTPHSPGVFHVYTHSKLFDAREPHSISAEEYLTFRNQRNEVIYLDTPDRLQHRAAYGEVYVIGDVPANKIEYGGTADNPSKVWREISST